MPWWYYSEQHKRFVEWAWLKVSTYFVYEQPQWAEMAEQLWAEREELA